MESKDIIATVIDDSGEFCIRFCTCMPPGVEGIIVEDCDLFENIYINARLPQETQRAAVLHELAHHYRRDFDRRVS